MRIPVISPSLLRPKCTGNVKIVSNLPTVHPQINENYLCHNDDLEWAKQSARDSIAMVDKLREFDTEYEALFPTKAMVNNSTQLSNIVKVLVKTNRHPLGTLRMGAQDNIQRGVLDGNLCVRGLQNVRVVDSSVFPAGLSCNIQAAVYAMAGKAVSLIQSTKCL